MNLFRIKALIALKSIEVGELGGFVEKEENLNHDGNARVYGDAEVSKKTHLLQIGLIGSRNDTTTFFRTKTKEIYVKCGCFIGNIFEFEMAVTKTHAGTRHEKVYKLAIELAKTQIELEGEEESEVE